MNGYTEFQQAHFKQQEMLAQAEQRRLEEIALAAAPLVRSQPLNRLLQVLRPLTANSTRKATTLIAAENRAG